MPLLDSYLVTMIFVIVALVYMLNVIKPFLRDVILRAKSKKPSTYRSKQNVGDWVRVFGIFLGVVFAFVFPIGTFAVTVIAGILLAAVADGSYANILKGIKLQLGQEGTTTSTVTNIIPAPKVTVTPQAPIVTVDSTEPKPDVQIDADSVKVVETDGTLGNPRSEKGE